MRRTRRPWTCAKRWVQAVSLHLCADPANVHGHRIVRASSCEEPLSILVWHTSWFCVLCGSHACRTGLASLTYFVCVCRRPSTMTRSSRKSSRWAAGSTAGRLATSAKLVGRLHQHAQATAQPEQIVIALSMGYRRCTGPFTARTTCTCHSTACADGDSPQQPCDWLLTCVRSMCSAFI